MNDFKNLLIPEGTVIKIKTAGDGIIWESDNAYITFSSPNSFSIKVETPVWTGVIEYSFNKDTWTTWDGSVLKGTVIYFRGFNNTQVSMDIDEIAGANWTISGSNVSCSGNLDSLLDYRVTAMGKHPEMGEYCYCSMFLGQTALIAAPRLPSVDLADFCYAAMFYGCTGLTETPELPAINLADYYYYAMFSGCENLTKTGSLPATTLKQHCYDGLFENCYNLAYLPKLPAITLVDSCYRALFYNCSLMKFSLTATGGVSQEYRVPTEGTGITANGALTYMVGGTAGSISSMPLNTTLYVSDEITIV